MIRVICAPGLFEIRAGNLSGLFQDDQWVMWTLGRNGEAAAPCVFSGILERSATDIVETDVVEKRIVPQESVVLIPPSRGERPSPVQTVTDNIGVKPMHRDDTEVGIVAGPVTRNVLQHGQRAVSVDGDHGRVFSCHRASRIRPSASPKFCGTAVRSLAMTASFTNLVKSSELWNDLLKCPCM